jgi:tetratricopeptide (TPR) repeat protein/tRNA A-37 threonylcarbamoyl transferase component Bud32
MIGERIGKIRIVDHISRGGMGNVYVGVDEKLNRKVAVKTLRRKHRLEPRTKARLLREAQILSQLDHRHTCRVHDLVEWQGHEYLVLELIEGKSLKQAMQEKMSLAEKIRIAEQVAEVLAVAHSRSIVHRDLKPANIMLTPSGDVKVLDFGLSRFLKSRNVDEVTVSGGRSRLPSGSGQGREDSADKSSTMIDDQGVADDGSSISSVETIPGAVMGTIAYMSPEQAMSKPITAASDLYSFGLILQELLTGQRPYDMSLSAAALLLKAAEGETRPISGVDPDLAALVNRLKSFAPASRPSAVDTLERLQWFRVKGRRQRWRRLIAAVIVMLVVFATVMAVQAMRIAREAERASQAAEAERKVSDFLVELLKLSDPMVSRGSPATAREILDIGYERVQHGLDDQPLTKAMIMEAMGSIYLGLGSIEKAGDLFKKALDIRLQQLPENHPDVAESLCSMGRLCMASGSYGQAESYFNRSLASYEAAYGAVHLDVAKVLNLLGELHHAVYDVERAEPMYLRALEIREELLPPYSEEVSECFNNLADIYRAMGEYDRSIALHKRSIEIAERAYANADLALVHRYNLAYVYLDMGELSQVEQWFRTYVDMVVRVLGENHFNLANALTSYGELHHARGEYEQARSKLERALAISESSLAMEHPATLKIINALGWNAVRQGRYDDAEAIFQRSLQVWERLYWKNPTYPILQHGLAENYMSLGVQYLEQGDDERARTACQKALGITEPIMGTAKMIDLFNDHAMSLICLGRIEEARAVVDQLNEKGWRQPDLAYLCRKHGIAFD